MSKIYPREISSRNPNTTKRYIMFTREHALLYDCLAQGGVPPYLQRPSNRHAWELCCDLSDLMLATIGNASEFGWHKVCSLPPPTPGLAAEIKVWLSS